MRSHDEARYGAMAALEVFGVCPVTVDQEQYGSALIFPKGNVLITLFFLPDAESCYTDMERYPFTEKSIRGKVVRKLRGEEPLVDVTVEGDSYALCPTCIGTLEGAGYQINSQVENTPRYLCEGCQDNCGDSVLDLFG